MRFSGTNPGLRFALLFCLLVLIGRDSLARPLDLAQGKAIVASNPAFSALPLSVECRVKLTRQDAYNIIVANQVKVSAAHWELFTTPGDGVFTAYVPGCKPDHARTHTPITDGAWHDLAMTADNEHIRLYVDGVLAADQAVSRLGKEGVSGPLSIGGLVEPGGFGCSGQIEELRLSKVIRAIDASRTKPLPTDADTITLWNFDQQESGSVPDLSGHGLQATLQKTPDFNKLLPLPEAPAAGPLRALGGDLAKRLALTNVKPETVRDAVWWEWKRDFDGWNKLDYEKVRGTFKGAPPEEVLDRNALVWKEDGGPAGTVIRRCGALLEFFKKTGARPNPDALSADLQTLRSAYTTAQLAPNDPQQLEFYLAACAIRRQVAFSNPLLDFDGILCAARGTYEGSVRSNPSTADSQGGHCATQYFGVNALAGGGLFILKDWKNKPVVTDLLKNAVVGNGRFKGGKLNGGAVVTPDLDFDGKRIAFAWSGNPTHEWTFSASRLWHLFSIAADGSGLTQLSDGAVDDFNPCWLPGGRLAFLSERRGGYIRCFSGLRVPQYSLFSMRDNGDDIIPLSYFETSEWNPSVNNDGMIVYTRWDYVDRENCLGTRFWICGPDGTNPRAPHGNYPKPWHTFSDRKDGDSRAGAPVNEMGIRAIPDSHRYLFTAAPHHGELYGSLCQLDLRIPDDGHMSQVKRITPDEPFSERELRPRTHYKYGTPWPLSEDFYLCNAWENLVLLDRFGNKELICDLRELPCAPDERLRVISPIPLRPRTRPPVIPERTNQGENARAGAPKATISVLNVYDTDQPFPPDTKIKWLRIVQNILKCNSEMGQPMIGYERENTPRIPLGIVPVEADGSAYFEAPIAKELIFQVLDENYMAVQSMRSVAFVHPGEQLSCAGCHENTTKVASRSRSPLAMQRTPSKIEPEIGPIEPISYYRQMKPIFESSCVKCHKTEGKGPVDMSYDALKEGYTFWFSGAMSGGTISSYSGIHGGSRTIPGRFGARYCKIGQALLDERHRKAVPEEIRHKVTVWLDCNSLRLGAYHREAEQLQGALVWPYLDVDPANPLGVEGTEPPLKHSFWHENQYGPHPFLCSTHRDNKLFIFDEKGAVKWEYSCNHPQDVWMLANGNVLVAWYYAVQEIKPDLKSGKGGEVVWEYKTAEPNQIPNCQPLPNGNVMIGIVGECRLIEVDHKGTIVHEVKLQTPVKTPHAQFRMCRKTPEGTYLVPFTAEGAVREYAADGKVLREFPRKASPVGVIRLPDGNTLISAGGSLTEYDAKNKIVWEVSANDIPDIAIGTLAGLQRLPSGNTIVCNWNPRAGDNKVAAQIFEVTHDKRVVWQRTATDIGGVAQCQLLTPELKSLPAPTWH